MADAELECNQLDQFTKDYCWKYIKECGHVILLKPSNRDSSTPGSSIDSAADIDIEPEVLESFKGKGFEVLYDLRYRHPPLVIMR